MITRRRFDLPSMSWQDPFVEMERMSRQMDQLTHALLGRPKREWFSSTVFPAVNLTENSDNYYVRAELPGIKAEAVSLQVTGRNLAISGERKIQAEGENTRYHRREREAGKFSRAIGLPGDIDTDRVDAEIVDGVLTVTIAKAETAKPKQIKVN